MILLYQRIIFLVLVTSILMTSCNQKDCNDDIATTRNRYRDTALFYSWAFQNNNHFAGDSVLIFYSNGDICSSTTSMGCNNGGGSFGAWTASMINDSIAVRVINTTFSEELQMNVFDTSYVQRYISDSMLYFTTCKGVDDGTIIQQARYSIQNDTILRLYNISHGGGIFGRNENIMHRFRSSR